MPRFRSAPLWPLSLPATAALLWGLMASGCGDASGVGKTYPVNGNVSIDGEPLVAKTTVVLFKPDLARANVSPFEPSGTVDATGRYALFTKGKKGAPPGWYKVIVTANAPETTAPTGKRLHHPHPKSLLPAKYGLAKTTDLAVEVVESPAPGTYDLKLTR
jgi:hypothetical protein